MFPGSVSILLEKTVSFMEKPHSVMLYKHTHEAKRPSHVVSDSSYQAPENATFGVPCLFALLRDLEDSLQTPNDGLHVHSNLWHAFMRVFLHNSHEGEVFVDFSQ